MRKAFILVFALLPLLGCAQQLYLVDPLTPIYPDNNDFSGASNQYALDFPGNSFADVHVVIKGSGNGVTPSANCDGKPVPSQYWSRLGAVPVDQNTGLESRTERWDGKNNPYVIRKAPFNVYDVIYPMGNQNVPDAGQVNYPAWRLSIPTSFFKGPGTYKVNIQMKGGGNLTGTFTVTIHKTSVPLLNQATFFFTNWLNLGKIEDTHKVKRGTPEWSAMIEKYAAIAAENRQSAILIPHEFIAPVNGKLTLDSDNMLKYVNIFKKYGFRWFEGAHLTYWNKVIATGHPSTTPRGMQELDTITKAIYKFVSQNNLQSQWVQHIADEVPQQDVRNYTAYANLLKKNFPGVKIIDATGVTTDLEGIINIWCPHINDFIDNIDFYNRRRRKGDMVLVYTSLAPGGPWLNRLLDQERLREVYFGWAGALYNTNGFLHWALNQRSGNPLVQLVQKNPVRGAKDNDYLPAGDSHIVYPLKDGPLNSIRFEAHRVGAEDYELLHAFNTGSKGNENSLIKQTFTDYTHYNTNVATYRKTRAQLLKALD